MSTKLNKAGGKALLCLILAGMVFAVYFRVCSCEFINYDDNDTCTRMPA